MRAWVFAVMLAACGSKGGPEGAPPVPAAPAGWQGKNDPEDLKALLAAIRDNATKDPAKAAALTRGLLVDAASVKVAVADAALADRLVQQAGKMPRDDAAVAGMLDPGKPEATEIRAHGATTEDIVANTPDGVVMHEFPGGARKLAEKGMLQKGVTFYEVEWTKPGEDMGMKYHLFFWDGAHWKMLGPAWRGVE